MKKLLTLLLAGSIFTTATFAQAKTATAPAKPEAKKEMKKQEAKSATADAPAKKVEPAKPAAAAKAEAPKLKKDGTPDMRMK
jgi:hypothetical protein